MAKDIEDPGTIDFVPNKPGRPVVNPDMGPLTPAEKMRRYRAGKKTVRISNELWPKIELMAERLNIKPIDALELMIRKARLPKECS